MQVLWCLFSDKSALFIIVFLFLQVVGDVGSAYRQNDMTAAYQAYQEEMQKVQTAGDGNPYVLESDQPKKKVIYVSRLQVMPLFISSLKKM